MTPKTRVLLIDDNEDLQTVLGIFGEIAGLELRGALDAEAGLREIHAFEPDVVLLDLLMPGHDGFWVLDAIANAVPSIRPKRLIIASAFTDRATMNRLNAFDIDAVLPKPFSLEEFRIAIEARGEAPEMEATQPSPNDAPRPDLAPYAEA